MSKQMNIAGLELSLDETPRGPLLSTSRPGVEPLAWLVNLAVDGRLRDLRESLEGGREVHYKGIDAIPDSSGNYCLSGSFLTAKMTVPVTTILEVLATLQGLRARGSVRVVPPPVELLSAPPATPGTRPDLPTGWDDLERRALELDELTSRDRSLENVVEESAKRRFLLLDLQAKGVFDESSEVPASFPKLHEYHDAALKVARYLDSSERYRFNHDAARGPVIGSPISVDWFRMPQEPGPAHMSEVEWLGFLENILTRQDVSGGQGKIFVHVREDWWTLFWRTDDGVHPCVIGAAQASAP